MESWGQGYTPATMNEYYLHWSVWFVGVLSVVYWEEGRMAPSGTWFRGVVIVPFTPLSRIQCSVVYLCTPISCIWENCVFCQPLQHEQINRLCSTLHIQATLTTLPVMWGFQPGFVPQKPIWSSGGRHACVAISPASHEPRPRSVWPWSLPSGPENPSRSRQKTPSYPFLLLWPSCKRYLNIRKHRNFEL